ncbi:MAG: SDR family NAD(P)-dependent oxidoreductase [Patescibacteria group bacterium]|nr:SDR family NAD(P)-dependent oxidoreductase [Patescibacteria group bacterium]
MANILVTGGVGFIGSNLVDYMANKGHKVTVFDNLSRTGVERNAKWLLDNHNNVELIKGDVRDADAVRNIVNGKDVIYHLAAQVAVTTSVIDPRTDFEINSGGTFNVLDAVRQNDISVPVVYTSTNKVYGGMEGVKVVENCNRYEFKDYPEGISSNFPLDFHSPYGCSKGSADQYVRDFHRIYGIPTVVFRMSCIYGPRQFGNEDQGWIAHFIISSIFGRDLNIYGNGKQIRDILYVTDLVRLFEMVVLDIDKTSGNVYNIGGGSNNTISLLELLQLLKKLLNRDLEYKMYDWRQGDQLVYVSDIGKACRDLGWRPEVTREEGIKKLFEWVNSDRSLFM